MSELSKATAAAIDAFDSSADLDLARGILARAGDAQPLSRFATALRDAGLTVSSSALPPGQEPAAGTGAARSDLPFALPVQLGLPVAQAPPMRAAKTSGPFRGASGSFWLHFFGAPELLSVTAAGAPRPTFVFTQGQLPQIQKLNETTIELAGGTVWILASALGSGLPGDAFAGFTVKNGRLTLTGKPAISGATVTWSGDLSAELEVTLGDGASVGGACPARPSLVGPSLRIVWKPGAPPAFTLGAATVSLAGTTLTLDPFAGPPVLDGSLDVVLFPYTIHPVAWDSSALSGGGVTFSGTTRLSGGWALSLVRPTPAAPLGEALGPGEGVFYCQDPLHAVWAGGTAVDLSAVRLVVGPGQLLLSSLSAAAATSSSSLRLRLWAVRPEASAPRLPLTLRFGAHATFVYLCDSAAGGAVYMTCGVDLALDRPVTLGGAPWLFTGADLGVFGVERGAGGATVRVVALARPPKPPVPRQILALRNALVAVTPIALATLEGKLAADGTSVDAGLLQLTAGEQGWLPTLPDPYVSNQRLAAARQRVPGSVLSPAAAGTQAIVGLVSWPAPPAPVVGFLGVLGGAAGSTAPVTPDPTRPVQQDPGQIRVPTQTAEGSLFPAPSAPPALLAPPVLVKAPELRAAAPETSPPGTAQRAAVLPPSRGLRLLDVSTNKDLLGVELGTGAQATTTAELASFTLLNLDVCTAAANLHVFTLPQVQWEPVRTLDSDQDVPHLGFFPTPLASVTDGGATQLGVQSVRLVPAIPDLAVDTMLTEFAAGRAAGLVTTLPFGLRAQLALRPQPSGGRAADSIRRNQPSFLKPDLKGAAQLAFVAESGPSGRSDSSHFDGYTLQLLNGVRLDTGAPLGISVLGSVVDPADSVESMFNNEFAPGGARPSVPVTRLDICGYGGSTFSDWTYRDAAYAEAGKVQFQVVVGRAALEVIKFSTVLYPWGIRLTRTVTIERRGGGGVIRRDSGWQASSPGLFQFPPSAVPGTSYAVVPGLLRGLFDVRNIVSTGMAPITFTGKNGKQVVLAPKFFDAQARIDGLEGATEVPAYGLLGFLQIEPVGEPLHEDDLRALLLQQGPAGGPIEGTVQVGGSGFRVRATRLEVDTALGAASRPELVGVLRCAPSFRQDGAWSAVRLPGPANPQGEGEAVNANDVRGLPVVREGQLQGVSGDTMTFGPQSDYRFCDAADLHQPDNPVYEYGLLQTSPAHLFLFPRPHVDAGVRELRSRSTPRFADIYARGTSKGAFPPAANAITLPANTLVVDPATGGFSLHDAVSLPSPRPPLILATSGADVMQVDYSGATLSLSFDQTQWNVDLPGLQVWTDVLGMQKATGLRTHLLGGTHARPALQQVEQLFSPVLEAAFTVMSGFGSRPDLGTVDLGATNDKHESKVSLIVERHWKFGDVPGVKFSAGGKAFIGWEKDDAPPPGGSTDTDFSLGLEAWGQVEGKIPIYAALYLLLGAQLEIGGAWKFDTKKLDFEMELQVYLGLGVKVGVFDGSAAVGYDLTVEDGEVKQGVIVLVQAELNLKLIDITVQGEFKGLWYADNTHPPNTHASDMGGEFEINVEIAFIGIHVSYEWQTTKYFT